MPCKFSLPLHALTSYRRAFLDIFLAIFTPNVLRESPIVAKSLDPQSSSSSRSLQFCQNHHRPKSSPLALPRLCPHLSHAVFVLVVLPVCRLDILDSVV